MELGVFKGGSLIQWATFRELLENENSREITGFDVFGEFPKVETVENDRKFVQNWNEAFHGEFLSDGELMKSLRLKEMGNIELIKGDIMQTLPAYLEKNGQLRIALLHIDTDVYEPCRLGLELLYDRVVPGGLIVFDDYGTVEGETRAVDEFFERKDICLHKFSFSHNKPCYMIKKKVGSCRDDTGI